jgi:hypothetical protein
MEKRRVSDGDRIEPAPYGTIDLEPLPVDNNTVDHGFSAKFDTNDNGGDNGGDGDGGDKRGDDDGENNDKDKEVSRGDTDAVEDVNLNIDTEIGIDGESEIGIDKEVEIGIDKEVEIGTDKEVEVEAVTEIGVDSETVKGEEQGERFLYSIFIYLYIFSTCIDMYIHVFIRSINQVRLFILVN